jgi:2-polyprenyl-6-hydroxyphenyl methylase/3-demethylubiquinone-9 3-methyltransferase
MNRVFQSLRRQASTASAASINATIKPSTISQDEISRFASHSAEWWNPRGQYALLHRMNPARMAFILPHISETPSKILDVGCGGGLISESLARIGHDVLGIDATAKSVVVAQTHAALDFHLDKLEYQCISVEELEGSWDVVVSLEVVEHVADLDLFLEGCCRVIKVFHLIIFVERRSWDIQHDRSDGNLPLRYDYNGRDRAGMGARGNS